MTHIIIIIVKKLYIIRQTKTMREREREGLGQEATTDFLVCRDYDTFFLTVQELMVQFLLS